MWSELNEKMKNKKKHSKIIGPVGYMTTKSERIRIDQLLVLAKHQTFSFASKHKSRTLIELVYKSRTEIITTILVEILVTNLAIGKTKEMIEALLNVQSNSQSCCQCMLCVFFSFLNLSTARDFVCISLVLPRFCHA